MSRTKRAASSKIHRAEVIATRKVTLNVNSFREAEASGSKGDSIKTLRMRHRFQEGYLWIVGGLRLDAPRKGADAGMSGQGGSPIAREHGCKGCNLLAESVGRTVGVRSARAPDVRRVTLTN